MSDDRTRRIDVSIELNADVDTVWTAITDAEELRRWFPLDAAVEPGVGGSISLSWGPDIAGTATIAVWEPGERLVWHEQWGGSGEQNAEDRGEETTEISAGAEVAGAAEAVPVAVDIRLESIGGATRLRLVHAGFGDDDAWDEYLDTLDSGWRYFLFNLKHYLERHRGQPRTMVWDRRKVAGDKAEIWSGLLTAYGLSSEALAIGDTADLWGAATATVAQLRPPIHLVLQIAELNDALLLVELEPGSDTFSLGTWLSLYGSTGERAGELEAQLRHRYDDAFPPAAD